MGEDTTTMVGYDVDPAALRTAVNKLKDQLEKLSTLRRAARNGIQPGELTARDATTGRARTAIENKAATGDDSLASATQHLADQLTKKIEAYEATLKQYEADDEAAAADAARIGQRA